MQIPPSAWPATRCSSAARISMRRASCRRAPKCRRFSPTPRPTSARAWSTRLLKRPEFVDYWAYKWSDMLLVSSRSLSRNNVRAFYGWIRDNVAANTPWDRFVYELTTATGRTDENGAANYFLIHRNPIELAENYTQAFLGITLTCARCHNHPMEKWTQNDYYGFANLFARVAMKEDGGASAKGDTATIVSTAEGDILHPRLGVAMPPRPLDGVPMASHAQRRPPRVCRARGSPRRRTRSSPGRSSIASGPTTSDAASSIRSTTCATRTRPATSRCSTALSAEFVAGGYDLRALMRTIMLSAAYQRSAETHARQREGRPLLLALPDAAPAGRGDPRRVLAGHRRAGRLRRLPARHAGAAVARHARGLVFPRASSAGPSACSPRRPSGCRIRRCRRRCTRSTARR